MTFQIRKSLLASADLFDIEVAAFAKEQRDWLDREVVVGAEKGRLDIAPIDRHHRYPAPTAHPLIMSAVNLETGKPDYELVDDPLDVRKAALANEVATRAADAVAAVISPAKLSAGQLRLAEIHRDEVQRAAEITKKHSGILQKLGLSSVDHDAVEAEIAASRSPEDAKIIADMNAVHQQFQAINRKSVMATAQIEDLTTETIDAYRLPEF